MIGLLGFAAFVAAARIGHLARGPLALVLLGWWLLLLLAHAPFAPQGLGRFFGGLALLGLAYRQGLRAIKAKAAQTSAPAPSPATGFRPAEIDRYARHLMLQEIGGPGQARLKAAKVLVVGAGGLGSPALLYLAASGVGQLGVIDDDQVESSNLQRQIIHTDTRLGMPKVFSAQLALKALNPFIEIRPYHRRLDEAGAAALFADYDLILDGSDNFDTRYLVNRTAVALGKPVIAAAMSQWEGQMSLYDPAHGTPCYACVFPQAPAAGLAPSCAEAGVMAALPGVMGSMMAVEAIKALTHAGEGLRGRLLIYNALTSETRLIRIKPRPDCPVCGKAHAPTA